MNRIKNIIVSCLLCALTVVAALGVLWVMSRRNVPISNPAVSYEQLEISIEFPAGTRRIHIWQDTEGEFYFFMPSGSENYQLRFSNLGEDSVLRLDSEFFTTENSVIEEIEYTKTYEIELTLPDKEVLETKQIVFLKSDGVPSLYIDTSSGSLDGIHADKETKEAASMLLMDSSGNSCYSGSMEYIRSRGKSSWNFEKKSYQIKLDKEVGLMDMPKAKKWILLANAVDDTLLKNEVVFRYAERYTNVPAVKGQFVDLYINGDYLGNYYLCEKIEVGENRLNITDLEAATEAVNYESRYNEALPYISEDGNIKATEGLNNPDDITGGYLLEHIPAGFFEEEENAFRTNTGECYSIVSPFPATVEQAEYICGLFNEMETAMAQEDGVNPLTGKHISEYLDLDSWAAKYVMEEFFHDPDSMEASMFMYKDSDSIDPLIYSGPMWDYDRALGSYGTILYYVDSAQKVGNYGIYVKPLMTFDEVRTLVYKKFEEEIVPYAENLARADIYKLNQQIKASADMDEVRWNQVHGYYVDRNAGVNYLSYFLEEKKDYLQDAWLGDDDYCTVAFLDYYGNVYRYYRVKCGDYLTEVPSIATFVAVFAGWYVQGEDIPYIADLPVLSDVTYESRWIDINIILQNGLNDLNMDLSQLDPEILENMAEVVREMQKAQGEENNSENNDVR